MASPNTLKLREEQSGLTPRPQHLIRRAATPIGKTGLFRIRTSAAPGVEMDHTGAMRNPARHMTEAERRALGLRRNGEPRRRARQAA
jgi:hypothetical protein